jgi:hypothetical protein
MSEYFVTSGKLKLKGAALPTKKAKRRKAASQEGAAHTDQLERAVHLDLARKEHNEEVRGVDEPEEPVDTRTPAERRFQEIQRQRVCHTLSLSLSIDKPICCFDLISVMIL